MNYSVKKVEQKDFGLLIPLMKDCFGINVNLNYFKWKFIDNPAGFVEGYVAVSDEGEYAAYYGVIPELYMLNGRQITIYQSCDTMTHSRHRRKGLFQQLALHCYEALRKEDKLFVIGFGGPTSTPGFLKFGWTHIFNMRYYFIPNIVPLLTKKTYEEIKPIKDPALIEHLLIKSNNNVSLHSLKNMQTFKWRISNPTFDYKLVGIQNQGQDFSSYVCFYNSSGKIILFDFYFSNIADGKKLIYELKKEMRSKKTKGIMAFVQEKSLFSETLKNLGFISNPLPQGPLSEKVPFIFYSTNENMAQFNDKNKWLVNAFDHDAL